ncbi:MAG TPA: hypothetical protein VHB48_16215, partial [Chitinophagaceae bacterium]|nr:hypothetical protein [Chitinophagaceae bacterium]
MKLIPTIKQFFYVPLLCLACVTACKKPNEGIIIAFNTDLIKYQVLLQFQDAATSTTVPSGIKVNIYGGDAENVYNSGGKKSYSVAGDGTLNLGIDPKRTPIAGSPVSFYVQASANGYITQTQKVVISQGQTFKKVTVKLINAATPPKGYNVIQKTYTLTNGVLSKPAIAGFAMNENRTGSDIADNTTEENAMQKLAGLVISNLSKASFAGTFANTLTNIVNSSVNKGLLFRAPAPPADTAYYDNGNVSVVIPKGATFY